MARPRFQAGATTGAERTRIEERKALDMGDCSPRGRKGSQAGKVHSVCMYKVLCSERKVEGGGSSFRK